MIQLTLKTETKAFKRSIRFRIIPILSERYFV